ncbi:hypothetical protein V9G51_002003 [Vibrio cholerae]
MERIELSNATIDVVVNGKNIQVQKQRLNCRGERFDFDRVAHTVKGRVDLDQLREDEFVIAPGLIYRRSEENSNG